MSLIVCKMPQCQTSAGCVCSMSNVIRLPLPKSTTTNFSFVGERAVIAEWDVKMRMVFGKGVEAFEFDLPSMSMTPNYIEDIVGAFRLAVEKAIARTRQ